MARKIALLSILASLLILGCSEDKNPVGHAIGFIRGKVTIDGTGVPGVTISVSTFSMTGGGLAKPDLREELAQSAAEGDYNIEVLPGLYKVEFSLYHDGEWLHSARYPIEVVSARETILDVDLKDRKPSSLLARNGDAEVLLSWEPGYLMEDYRVYRSTADGGNFEMIDQIHAPGTSTIFISNIPPSIDTYFYRVTAIENDIETQPSNEATVGFTGSIGAPAGFQAKDKISHVELSWESKANAIDYHIYRAVSTPDNWIMIDSTGQTAYNDNPGEFDDYYYRVTAVSAFGIESAPSTQVLVAFDGRYDPPSGLTLIDRGSNIYLTWVNEGYIGYFNIYRSRDPEADFVRIDSTFNAHYEDIPTVYDYYYYQVTIVGPNGIESERSATVSTFFDGRLDPPDMVQAEDRGLSVEVSWSEVLWTGAYIVYRSEDTQTYHQIARVSANYQSYSDQPPLAGNYSYKVSTETVDGVEGPLSQPTSVFFSDNLMAPENVSAENFGTFVIISWDLVSDATGYRVYRSTSSGGGYVEIGQTDQLEFIDVPQTSGPYYYKVKAYDNIGHESQFSFYAYVLYTDIPLPPHNLTAEDSLYKVGIYWSSENPSYEYIVFRSNSSAGEYLPIDTVAQEMAVDWPSRAGHFYYKVKAMAGPNRVSDFSDDVHVYFSGILATPTNLEPDTAGGYVSLTWNAVEGASEYDIYRGVTENQLSLIQTVYSPECTDAPSVGGTYYYAVTAKTQGGLESPRSAPVVVVYQP